MRVLWTHNFPPDVTNAGTFMNISAAGIRDLGIHIDFLYLGNLGTLGAITQARREVRDRSNSYDLVHAQYGSACAYATSAARAPKVLSLRGSDWHRYRGLHFREWSHGLLAHFLTRQSLNCFNQIIVMSRRMEREVKEHVPSVPVSVVADPIRLDIFKPMDRIASRLKLFDYSGTEPWVLFTTLSRTNPIKRAELAFEAVKCASRSISGLQLKVASGLQHTDMPAFIATCNVALCTSTHEGWPNSIKEALACGLPFVSTDVSDLAEVAKRHSACQVCESSIESLANGLVHALQSPSDLALREELRWMDPEYSARRIVSIYQHTVDTQI